MQILNHTAFKLAYLPGRICYPGHSLTVIVKGTFALTPQGKAVATAGQEFPTGDEHYPDDEEQTGSCYYESDFAHLKPHADLLLVGKCHPPGGTAAPACRVTFAVGAKSNTLNVFGDRVWGGGLFPKASDPTPFTEMDLRYENSFGGEGFEKNPVGTGCHKVKTDEGKKIQPLPNIDWPNAPVTSPDSRPEPAGFGPVGKTWKDRSSMLGTYKKKYLNSRWPWFAEDFNPNYFNAAPPSMQVEGFLGGDERLCFENLHPEHPRYETELPGQRVRCFLNDLDDADTDDKHFREIGMNLDTLWVDMEAEKLVLVWRGWSEVESEEFEEIRHMVVVSEPVADPPESIDHYRELFRQQLAESNEEEVPAEVPAAGNVEEPDEDEVDVEAVVAKADEDRRTMLTQSGIDPDNLPPPSEESKAYEAKILKELGVDLSEQEREPITNEVIRKRMEQKESFEDEDLTKFDLAGLDMAGLNLRRAVLSGVSLCNANLSGADLTGANLTGADLCGATLVKADLKEADLTMARLSEAVLTGAALDEATFESATMNAACLKEVKANYTRFVGADLTEAQFAGSDCSSADFSGCRLDRANFRGAKLRQASMTDAVGLGVDFEEADLSELRASGGDFSSACFIKTEGRESIWEGRKLDEADFRYSRMEAADFTATSLVRANLSATFMRYARFTKSDLQGATMLKMDLFQGSVEKANLTKTDLRGSNLYGAEFLDAVIEETRLDLANLKMTKLSGA